MCRQFARSPDVLRCNIGATAASSLDAKCARPTSPAADTAYGGEPDLPDDDGAVLPSRSSQLCGRKCRKNLPVPSFAETLVAVAVVAAGTPKSVSKESSRRRRSLSKQSSARRTGRMIEQESPPLSGGVQGTTYQGHTKLTGYLDG